MKRNKTYRIRTGVNDGVPSISFNIDSSVETYEILSLKISQKNAYKLMASDKGVVAGRVLANGGFGVPNARVSIFVPYEGDENMKRQILYHFASSQSLDDNGIRYNLLPDGSDDECHQVVGTFPNKRIMLDDDNWVEVFDKYYRYTTRTNASGDYMIYGVPTGDQAIHMDVDLSDIGPLSQRPRDMMIEGYSDTMFESPSKFKSGTNLNSLVQIKSEDTSLYVYPFWGDTTSTNTNACITRHDIPINYTFKPTCVFLGGVITDTGENAMSKKCIGSKKQGKMSDMVTGEGKIEMIRKTFDGNTEQFSIQGNRLIDSNGTWCYQIPMNLDYVMTDEFGNTVLSDDPGKGIPTRARVRFRISMSESPNDATARKRARYLVPNNPHLNSEDFTDYPEYTKTKEPDYEFGTETKDENFRDLMWNNVYTVKNYIPRIQKSNLPNNLRHIGIKMVNHPQGNNPMPFNNLRIKMNFNYMFMCALIKVLVYVVLGINTVLTMISYAFFKVAEFMIALTNIDVLRIVPGIHALAGFWDNEGRGGYERAEIYGKHSVNPFYTLLDNRDSGLGYTSDSEDGTSQPYNAACYMLAIIARIAATYNPSMNISQFKYINLIIGTSNPPFTYQGKKIGVKGFAAKIMAVVYKIGCGITLRGLCETEEGEELNTSPGTLDAIKNIFEYANETFFRDNTLPNCDDDVAKLFNCIENELAQENEVTSFNFYNDWINGVLYFPLWYRKIKPKRKFFGVFEIKAKDQWCSTDTTWIKSTQDKRQIKIYDTCVQKKSFNESDSEMGVKFTPLEDDYSSVNVTKSVADDETGIEVVVFNQIGEKNCYGYQCHKHARTNIPIRSGLMKEKETMLGDLVYYYKPCEYNTKYAKDTVTLFATDIVLLGSLSDCDIHGVPQFFKALEGTTYNMPPSLLSETYEYSTSNEPNTDEFDSTMIDETTRKTEYTGADWGNLGVDQSNFRWTSTENNKTYEANENIYDNGGLFYGITCFSSFTKPKSCINLSRICEFGVSLDESQDILSTSALQGVDSEEDISDTMYTPLTPDGFVSYDEVYNPDYRSMFATMNANFLRTKLNYDTGMYEYDFNHLYIDNFDGIMSKLMNSQSVKGKTKESNYSQQANYVGNYNLEKSSDAYLNFRYGNYRKKNNNKIYLYEYNQNIVKVKGKIINSKDRLPRYENSFYFYFGLLEGKTAIDRFYSTYYSECTNDIVLPKNYEITPTPNTVCLDPGVYDGNILFSFNSEPPINITITNRNNDMEVYTITDVPYSQFYVGVIDDPTQVPAGYSHVDITSSNTVDFIPNGVYNMVITTGDGDIIQTELNLTPEDIAFNADVFNFTCKNTELDSLFSVTNPDGTYDWSQMFPAIANYTDDGAQITSSVKRVIGGYITVNVADLQRFSIGVEPMSTYFFREGDTMLYSAPLIDVIDGTIHNQSGDGYLGQYQQGDGTFYVFGVPYGGQRYKVVVSELCYDGTTITRPEHKTIETVTVGEGVFKMFINNIDYDIIKSFKTGWDVLGTTRLDSPNPPFTYSSMYGWNELNNIGKYYNPVSEQVENIRHIEYTDNNDVIIAMGDILCDDYDGNGVNAPIMPSSTERQTPYTWGSEHCIDSGAWDVYRDKSRQAITAMHLEMDEETDDPYEVTITDITRNIEYDGMAYEYVATYSYDDDGQTVLVCTEHENGEIVYEEGYSAIVGLMLYDIMSMASTINNVVDNRREYTKRVIGAFRTGASETSLTLTYKTPSTPIKYLIGGSIEISASKRLPRDDDSSSGQHPSINFQDKVVFDTNLQTDSVIFSLPTITYDGNDNEFKPYVMNGITNGTPINIDKIPYYVSIQNSQGISIPTSGSAVLGTQATTRFVDNFNEHVKDNPFLSRMFGVHFFDNPMYYSQVMVVCGFSHMPKYDDGNNTYIEANSLVMGYAVNGISPLTVTLDYEGGQVRVASHPSDVEYYDSHNNRLLYDNSETYGKYELDPSFADEDENEIEYQYMTFPRNRIISVRDEYGPGYESTVYCDYMLNTENMKLVLQSDSNMNIPLNLTRLAVGSTKYHILRYTGTNHPLNIAVRNAGDGTWMFPGDAQTGEMNDMFKPTYTFDNHPDRIYTVNGNGTYVYNPQPQYKSNQVFIVAQNDRVGVRVFSPVLELAHISSIYCFNANPAYTQDEYTIYLMRRPMNDADRQDCNITDFKYYTDYPFTLVLKQYNNETGGADEVLRYEINPSPSDIKTITLTDYNENNEQVVTHGKALKISLTQYRDDFSGYGYHIPNWLSLWGIDTNGVERRLVGTTGPTTTVVEEP